MTPTIKKAKRIFNLKTLLAGAVSLITFIVYLTALQNNFVDWDDSGYVFENPHIRSLNWTFFKWAFLDLYQSNWHPLTWISHALDYAAWGLNPVGHHLTNNILHAINTFVVVLLGARLLKAGNAVIPARRESLLKKASDALAVRTQVDSPGRTGMTDHFGLSTGTKSN
jgi:hypothetical protein